jgi:hypothetical protein
LTSYHCGEVFDAIVTGFVGAVVAARLVHICMLERGWKFEPNDFPVYPNIESLQGIDGGQADETEAPDLARWLWAIDQGLYDPRAGRCHRSPGRRLRRGLADLSHHPSARPGGRVRAGVAYPRPLC